jgi:hypothetical protein
LCCVFSFAIAAPELLGAIFHVGVILNTFVAGATVYG